MEEENLFNTVKSVEFYVGSAKHWAYFHQMAMGGFRPVATPAPPRQGGSGTGSHTSSSRTA